MMMKKLRIGVTLGFFSLMAGVQAHADAWTGAVNLSEVSPQDNNGALLLLLTTSQAIVDPAQCSQTPSGYVVLDPVVADAILATSLSAINTGTQVQLFVTTTAQQVCFNGRPVVTSIVIL